jgi:hypothetical protein
MIFFLLAFYKFLFLIKLYCVGITKSKTLSDPSILDEGYQNINVIGM